MQESVLAQIMVLNRMSISELREKWSEVFDDAPESSHKAYLFQRIAWRVQELAHGRNEDGNPDPNDLLHRHLPQRHSRQSRAQVQKPHTKSPVPRLRLSRDSRIPIAVTIITKIYKGQEISVRVLERGFEHEGQKYRSLSAVAKAVTGTSWNGYSFFGLSAGKDLGQ